LEEVCHKVLYKGKGDLSDLDACREIALECAPFKLFTKLLTKELTILTDSQMPDNVTRLQKRQIDAPSCTQSTKDVQEALRLPGRKLFVVFLDFSKALDMLNRAKLVTKRGHSLDRTAK
jgi:hypothetical protein